MSHSREAQSHERVNKRKVKKWAKDVKVMLRATEALKLWIKQTLSRVHMTDLSWSTRVGIGDAAYTAVLIGWVWSIKSIIIGYLSYQIHFEQTPKLQVVPVWEDEMEFQTELDWKLKIRITAVLIAGITLLTRVLQVEGGWRMWFKLLKEQRRRRKLKLKRQHSKAHT